LQYHNAWPAASESSVIQNYREIKTVRAAIGKTGVPRLPRSKRAWRLPTIHAADFDAGLAAHQAADRLTTSVARIAFCGSVDRVASALRKEHWS